MISVRAGAKGKKKGRESLRDRYVNAKQQIQLVIHMDEMLEQKKKCVPRNIKRRK